MVKTSFVCTKPVSVKTDLSRHGFGGKIGNNASAREKESACGAHFVVLAMKKRKQYTDQELSSAVSRVIAGEGLTAVAEDTRVPVRTIAKYVKMHRDGTPTIHARRGPPPMLTVDGEADLVSWIHGMQSNGTPACRAEILMQGRKIATMLSGERVVLSDGWYGKFMGRDKELTNRQAQIVSRTRNECSLQKLSLLFQTLLKVIIEDNLDATRIYNMDETSFMTRKKNARV